MKTKFIFSYIDQDKEGIYRDLTLEQNKGIIDFIPSHIIFKNKYLEKVKKGLLSNKMGHNMVGKFFQAVFANLEHYPYQQDTQYYIIIPSTSVGKLSIRYIKHFIDKHDNVKLFPILTDSMHASSPHMENVRSKLFSPVWEKVLTFDKNDAEEYGFTWFGYTWYSSYNEIEPSNEKTDLFYIGYKKGNRENLIANIYMEAKKHNINCDFRVVSQEEKEIIEGCDLCYTTQRYRYPEVVSHIKASNCLLEVLQEGQNTQTIKYYEAVAYGKKLLTNYMHVKELPFYNESQIRYFRDISEIDWEWVKKPVECEYEYQNEFSPIKIVDFIKRTYKIE